MIIEIRLSRIITIGVTIATAADIGVVVALNIVAAATMVKPFMHIMFLDPIQSNPIQSDAMQTPMAVCCC